eukprot:3430758-Prymnesium_polylepis.1
MRTRAVASSWRMAGLFRSTHSTSRAGPAASAGSPSASQAARDRGTWPRPASVKPSSTTTSSIRRWS